jgi:hypothetical protein
VEVNVAVYAVNWFRRWMKQHGLVDRDLCDAVHEMARGLIDADLGGGLLKKRLPRFGQGKRGGFRTIVATRRSGNWFFIYGFAKSDRGNIGHGKALECRGTAQEFLALSSMQCDEHVQSGKLFEVNCHAQVANPI